MTRPRTLPKQVGNSERRAGEQQNVDTSLSTAWKMPASSEQVGSQAKGLM